MPGRAGGDSCERPASKMYRISIKIIRKSIDLECRGEQEMTPASGRHRKSIDFQLKSLRKISIWGIARAFARAFLQPCVMMCSSFQQLGIVSTIGFCVFLNSFSCSCSRLACFQRKILKESERTHCVDFCGC